jgi:tRNA-dihydrouridine synthase B
VRHWLHEHLQDHYGLYGDETGVRTARKHIGWAVRHVPGGEAFRAVMNTLQTPQAQLQAVLTFFDELAAVHPRWPAANDETLPDRAALHDRPALERCA